MQIEKFKKKFDEVFKEVFENFADEAVKIIKHKPIEQYLYFLRKYIFFGGKRGRPYLTYMFYKIFGGKKDDEVIKFSIVNELMHSMALIHDDIIDEGEKRHHVETIHIAMRKFLDYDEKKSNWEAMLIGDLVFARTFEYLNSNFSFKKSLIQKAQQEFFYLTKEVILGQMIDVELAGGYDADPQILDKKNLFKTARYSFSRPMRIGAILAGIEDEKILDYVMKIGDKIGLAFQIYDDISDVIVTQFSKSVYKDIEEGQQTYMSYFIFNKADKQYAELFKKYFGKKIESKQDKDMVDMIILQSGAFMFAKEKLDKYLEKGMKLLKDLSKFDAVNQNYLDFFIKFIDEYLEIDDS